MGAPFYITRERFMAAASVAPDVVSAQTIDRLLDAASRGVEEMTNRHFYPFTQTRYYDWPAQFGLTPIRVYLNADLLSVNTLTVGGVGGTVLSTGNYYLEPVNYATDGGDLQAYSRIEINLATPSVSFVAGPSPQRSIVVDGVWGYSQRTTPAGTLAAAINSSVVTVTLSDSSLVGVGDLVKIDSEQLFVTEKALATTGTTLNGNLTADNAIVTVPVVDGTKVFANEIITIDSERMFVESVSGNNLTVKRAYQDSVLAAHTSGVTVYAPRSATVERGSVGTTAAAHLINATMTRNVPPQKIADYVLADVVSTFLQEKSGYARTIGQGETIQQVTGRALTTLAKEIEDKYGRRRGPVAV